MIPYGRQSIDESDVAAVAAVLRGDWLTGGPHVEAFEAAVARRVGARFGVAFANGTAALHGACAAAGLGPGDVVATSALSFVASANCARYVGATPTLVDIDPETLNLDPAQVPAHADALVAVHFAGLPLDLTALAHRPRVIIEDAAHALGAETPDGPVGNCARSDMCVFSFHPVKAVTTGEGGLVTTNDEGLAEALRRFRNHGMVRHPERGEWYYEIEADGYNYRLTDIAAALGTSQLRRLDRFLAARDEQAGRYRSRLGGPRVTLPPEAGAGYRHGRHLFVVRVPERDRVYAEMRAAGVGVQVHYVPIYRHPILGGAPSGPEQYPETERAYASILSLPLHPGLGEADQDTVIAALERAL